MLRSPAVTVMDLPGTLRADPVDQQLRAINALGSGPQECPALAVDQKLLHAVRVPPVNDEEPRKAVDS